MLPTIVLTMGDPAGVGPEIVLKALADPEIAPLANWIVAGDARILAMAELQTGCPLRHARLHDIREGLEDLTGFDFGKLDARCGTAGVAYVRVATELCLRGEADAMVTAPLNKEAVTLSGRPFSGHTEYIAELCGATESRMLLASERLSTVHVSTHLPLRSACDLDQGRILRTIELGNEAMKLIDFEGTVNVSLGIPIIRTSVDHGTAFDIAGKNRADARSMKQAMRLAARMAAGRGRGR